VACWSGTTYVLWLMLGLFGFSAPVLAHGGHSHGKAAKTNAAPAGAPLGSEPAAAQGAWVEVASTEHFFSPAATPEPQLAVHLESPSFNGALVITDNDVQGVEERVADRWTCPCGLGCGSCTSSSCCVSAVWQSGFVWTVQTTRLVIDLALEQRGSSFCGDPLPRPPNPVRLSTAARP
jgi:hypothetical protein